MSAPVEALSISSLTSLFANPPQYPRNPTHQKQEPLVLYIFRVPGSKDVFLSPLKPPTKASISLEAIQSSLYYLHVETPEDETIRQSFEAEWQLEQQKAAVPSVLRKPLPPTPFANYPASHRPETPPKSYPHYQPPGPGSGNQVDRYGARGSHLRLNVSRANSVPRKPVGARPLPSQQTLSVGPPDSPRSSTDSPNDTRRWSVPDGKPAPWVPRLQVPADSMAGIPEQGQVSDSNTGQDQRLKASSEDLTTIALIRRDPTSGTQWNVGTIKVTGRKGTVSSLQPIEVALASPGYVKFARTHELPRKAAAFDDVEQDLLQGKSRDSPSPSSTLADSIFRRRVGFRPLPEDHKLSLQHVRTNSSDVLSDIANAPARKMRQVYAFTSPWQGICAFSNGADGRTLKCKHSLPASRSYRSEVAAPVAEIRFNLPWPVLRNRDLSKHNITEAETIPISQLVGKTAKDQWRKSVQNLKPRSWHAKEFGVPSPPTQPSTSRDGIVADDDGRISLKLGREKAGGGFKGDSAKLGKLVIEDEGLKMCDLAVASCMGLWWQHYLGGSSSTIT